ncbi:Aste57867_7916 [Aphanomyces stellatus]|uniref:Aste57867_7916 protein n=1 Tax=Aphanomyces stellatus TaxID=120398 RepID=A0A485KIZ8_9STRA|nr:hypothetical protein As57867_007886 [Aphanomyces stellatus]VFT84809.1 Aste57867_7916 [Aphanomyces stellatus]
MLPPLVVLSILASTVAASAHLNIVHGTEAAVGVAPYVVSVRLDNAAASTTCSGVLVAPRFVLTAAHCVFDGSKQYASIGSHFGNGTTDGERISVQLATRHPRYNITSKDFDFAVLKLTYRPRIVHAQPIAISWDVYPPGTLAMHRGFGIVNYTTYLSVPALQETPTLIRPDADCSARTTIKLTANMLCTIGGTSCRGDSGGPLTVRDATGQDKLIGISSWGDTKCESFAVFSRVAGARDFIEDLIDVIDDDDVPPERYPRLYPQ